MIDLEKVFVSLGKRPRKNKIWKTKVIINIVSDKRKIELKVLNGERETLGISWGRLNLGTKEISDILRGVGRSL